MDRIWIYIQSGLVQSWDGMDRVWIDIHCVEWSSTILGWDGQRMD